MAAAAVKQNIEGKVSFQKLAEGGFNRTFLVTMRDGFQFVGRIPYSTTEPNNLVIASEVATMDFLRSHGMPIPKMYSYSATAKNAAGTEYIFMERVQGTNLGDVWFDPFEKARITVVTKLVELESQLFTLKLPENGSLYYTKDLQDECEKIEVPVTDATSNGEFSIGPDPRLSFWHVNVTGNKRRVSPDEGRMVRDHRTAKSKGNDLRGVIIT